MYCEKCGTKMEKGAKFCNSCGHPTGAEHHASAAVEYFAISPGRLILFSVLTFNLYEVFWFYKNWLAIQKAENTKIAPFWRSVFTVFFCFDFFKRVLESAKNNGYKKVVSAGWIAAAYIILLFIGNAVGRMDDPDGTYLFWTLVLLVLTPLPLIPIQQAINFNNEKVNPAHPKTNTFTGSEVALIVVGIIIMGLVLFGSLSS